MPDEFVLDVDVLLTSQQVAAGLSLSTRTLKRHTEKKTIPFVKLGGVLRFRFGDIVTWVVEGASDRPDHGSYTDDSGVSINEYGDFYKKWRRTLSRRIVLMFPEVQRELDSPRHDDDDEES